MVCISIGYLNCPRENEQPWCSITQIILFLKLKQHSLGLLLSGGFLPVTMNVLITVMPHREGGEGGESEVSSFSSEVLTPATAVWGLCRHWLSLPLCLPLTSLLPSLQLPKQGAGDNNSYVLSPAPCHTFLRHQFHLYLLCRVRPVHTAVSEPLSGKFIWVQMPLPL